MAISSRRLWTNENILALVTDPAGEPAQLQEIFRIDELRQKNPNSESQ